MVEERNSDCVTWKAVIWIVTLSFLATALVWAKGWLGWWKCEGVEQSSWTGLTPSFLGEILE